MDGAYYEDIAGRLRGLQIRLSDRLPDDSHAVITEFIDHNELGLALEQMADLLAEDEKPLSPDERTDMLILAKTMEIERRVNQALALCPPT